MGPDAMSLGIVSGGKDHAFRSDSMFFSHAPVDEPSLEIVSDMFSGSCSSPASALLLEKNGWGFDYCFCRPPTGTSSRYSSAHGRGRDSSSNPGKREIEPGKGLVMQDFTRSLFLSVRMWESTKKAVVWMRSSR